MSALWNRCLLASLAVNGLAVGALGVSHFVHPDASIPQRVGKAAKKPPTRLMEIRMESETPEKGSEGDDRTGNGAEGDAASGSPEAKARARASKGGRNGARAWKGEKPARPGAAKPGNSKAAVDADFGRLALKPPRPRTVHSPSGVVDLRNVHITGTTSADPKLLAKNQPPNKTIGKGQVKVVGKATSLAKCVGAVGGNTVFASKLTILLGKGIDIKGTKYCVPGGVPGVPGSGTSQGGSNANLPRSVAKGHGDEKGDASGSKAGTGSAKGASAADARDGGANGERVAASPARASGPVRNVDEPWVSYGYRGGGKRMGGPSTDLHLPASHDDPTDRVRPASVRPSGKPATFGRFEPAPVSVGSHSERGTIPWGPDSRKRRPRGLKGDYYEGNEFERFAFSRIDPNVDFVWTNRTVDPRLPTRRPYSVRWTGFLKADHSETYTIYTSSDDGVRLWIDGRLAIDNWTEHAPQENVVRVPLVAGREMPIRLEYFEIDGLQIQVMKLYWESPSQPKAYVPARSLFQPRP